jgi:hypothetical protein
MQRRMNGRSAPPASAALTKELHEIIESDRYPCSPRIPHLESDPRQTPTRAGSRALDAVEGLCAAVERPLPETWLR